MNKVKLTFDAIFDETTTALQDTILGFGSRLIPVLAFAGLLLWLAVKQASLPDPFAIPHVGYSNPVLYWYSAIQYAISPETVLRKVTELRYSACKIPTLSGWIVVTSKALTIDALKKVPDCFSLPKPSFESPNFLLGELKWILGALYYEEEALEQYRETVHDLTSLIIRQLDTLMPRLQRDIEVAVMEASRHEGLAGTSSVELTFGIMVQLLDKSLFGEHLACHPDIMAMQRPTKYIVQAYTLWKPLGKAAHRIFTAIYARSLRNAILVSWNDKSGAKKASTTQSYLRTLLDADTSTFSMKSQLMTVQCLLTLRTWTLLKLIENTSGLFQHLADMSKSESINLEQMRDEIVAATRAHGWSVRALNNMPLVNSFVKESMRLGNLNGYAFYQTYQTGSRHPGIKGTIPGRVPITVPNILVHLDPHRYPSPELFIPHRFAAPHRSLSSDASSLTPVDNLETTSTNFLAWGYGAHACPGRFFGSSVMKLLVATLVQDWRIETTDEHHTGKTWKPRSQTIVIIKRK